MSYPFKKILCPVDFDENSAAALEVAAQIARRNDGDVLVLHIVPMVLPATDVPVYTDVYKQQQEAARNRVKELAESHLRGVKHESVVRLTGPASGILAIARKINPDVIVMATHGRRGVSRFLLGSVAEAVLREAQCPVLTVRAFESDKRVVAGWMTAMPVTARPEEKLDAVQARMREGDFRSMPVVDGEGRLVGIVTDRDLRRHTGYESRTDVGKAMSEDPVTVAPATPVAEAARLLMECKVGALPVLEEGKVVGIVSTTDIFRAFLEEA
jgi:acetoin utilization protein AcuB